MNRPARARYAPSIGHAPVIATLETFDDQDWGAIGVRLALFVRRRGRGSLADADVEQLTQESLKKLAETCRTQWCPGDEHDVMTELGSIANGLLRNFWRKKYVTHETLPGTEPRVPDRGESPEHEIAARQLASLAYAKLRARAEANEDGQVLDLIECLRDGVTKPRDQASKLCADIKDIRNARRRLDGHLAAVRKDLDEEEL